MRIYPSKPEKVYFYATCVVDMFDPEAGLDAITLLEQQGIEVIYKEKQTCCGQPAYTSGYDDEAKQVALSQMALFDQDYPVIVLSGSCGGMMHHHYRRLFSGEPNQTQVEAFCDRVFELTEFLVKVCRVKLNDQGEPTTVAMHTSCTARREMGVNITATELLSQLDNVSLKIQDYESECCGFGGTFSVRHPNISQAMVEDKTKHLVATQAEYLVSADWGCLLNINGALDYQGHTWKGRHIASFLLERTGGA
ncbi:(Fe-S)-binding protein [Vibrio sp. SCSIO 43136]|uniref:(Fe-S)-binding protein n=1 Tax=Vibrio sp. SCSIO 43136 TaxID=2819101 RepID=UPI002075F7F6|nr:(Fe-S)-binding protein [Vibrio sp. SCSIO 43136]USD67210.1 (Fe-S)-binding protein [Vibrio sp. SCSIO 43136]